MPNLYSKFQVISREYPIKNSCHFLIISSASQTGKNIEYNMFFSKNHFRALCYKTEVFSKFLIFLIWSRYFAVSRPPGQTNNIVIVNNYHWFIDPKFCKNIGIFQRWQTKVRPVNPRMLYMVLTVTSSGCPKLYINA